MPKTNGTVPVQEEKRPLFGLRTLKNSVKWFYFAVFIASAGAAWSVWIDVNSAIVPPSPIYNTHGVQINAWTPIDYADKYVLMALILGAIIIGGPWVITHYGKLLSLYRKKSEQETKEEKFQRKMGSAAIIASLAFILLAELAGRALVFFFNNQAYDARVWFIAFVSMGLFVWCVMLSPSVEKIDEEHSQRSEKEEQEVFHKDVSDWFRRRAFKRFKKQAESEINKMNFAQITLQLEKLAPGFKDFLVEEVASEQEKNEQQQLIEGKYQLLEERVGSLHSDLQKLPGSVTDHVTKQLDTLLADKMSELQKTLTSSNQPDPEPPPRGGVSIEEEPEKQEDTREEVVITGELIGAGFPQITRRVPLGPLDLLETDKQKSINLGNVTPIRQDVRVVKKAGRKPLSQVRQG